MSSTFSPEKVKRELAWLQEWPQFDQRPADIGEFLGPDYLNIEKRVRVRLKDELEAIVGEQVNGDRITRYPLAIFTGAIGIGKTTVASIVLPYLVHWTLCLRDPQGYFDLLPGSRIAFMQMSTSERQAKEVVFGDIKARIDNSPWFQENYPRDTAYKNQIRFDKEIWILPGDSTETSFEGYNILGGILDEADSHKRTKYKDYAEAGFETIHSRVTSRFGNRGFTLIIGQMKMGDGFAARKYEEFLRRDDAYASRLTIWESFGWDYYRNEDGSIDTFYYDTLRKQIIPPGIVGAMKEGSAEHLIEVPSLYLNDFKNNPEKALRDLAGIPPSVGDPFISLTHKIYEARDRWVRRYGPESPVRPDGRFEPWFRVSDKIKRTLHLDLAYSADGDALGMAMGHVRGMVTREGEEKPYIIIDMLLRMKAPSGGEIFLGDVRRVIYTLRDDFGFNLRYVTMDGFQSTDTNQQLRKKRFHVDYLSMDKDIMPYHDLREALYEDRIEFPKYLTYLEPGSGEQVEILATELETLVDQGNKIDHSPMSSKDVADAVAGVTHTLMGDRSFRSNKSKIAIGGEPEPTKTPGDRHIPGMNDPWGGVSAPPPPNRTRASDIWSTRP